MLSLYSSVGRLVIRRDEIDLDSKYPLEVHPQVRLVGKSIIASDLLWTTIPLHPASNEAITAVDGSGSRHRDAFRPFRPAAHDGQNIFHPLALRKRPHYICVEVSKACVWYLKYSGLWFDTDGKFLRTLRHLFPTLASSRIW